jgi:hypothetical protein
LSLACRSDWLCLEPQSQIKYFLPCTRSATLACNASEFARQLPVTLAVSWRDNSFRLSHHWFSPAPKPAYKALTLLAVSRFRGGVTLRPARAPPLSLVGGWVLTDGISAGSSGKGLRENRWWATVWVRASTEPLRSARRLGVGRIRYPSNRLMCRGASFYIVSSGAVFYAAKRKVS